MFKSLAVINIVIIPLFIFVTGWWGKEGVSLNDIEIGFLAALVPTILGYLAAKEEKS